MFSTPSFKRERKYLTTAMNIARRFAELLPFNLPPRVFNSPSWLSQSNEKAELSSCRTRRKRSASKMSCTSDYELHDQSDYHTFHFFLFLFGRRSHYRVSVVAKKSPVVRFSLYLCLPRQNTFEKHISFALKAGTGAAGPV